MNASARSRCASAPSASTASRILHPPRQACDPTQQWRQEETIESDAWNRIKEHDRQHGVTETWSQVADASRRYSTQTGDSEMASLDESLSANLSRMRSFQEPASLSLQVSESWSAQAAQLGSDVQAIERELGQPFFAWLSERKGTDGHALGAVGAMRIASPQTAEDSEQLRECAETETDLIMHDAARGARQTVTKQEIAEGGGPDGWRPGLCRQRQDLHAEPRPRALGEGGLRGPGPRSLGLGRAQPPTTDRSRLNDPWDRPSPGSAWTSGRVYSCSRRRGSSVIHKGRQTMPKMATVRDTLHVAARTGKGFEVATGDLIRITDLEGSQPVDFWTFSKDDHLEFLSCEHTKPSIEKLFPHVGDAAFTNRRRRIVTVVDDTSPGQHDMQYAACDPTRYVELGVEGYHESCQENLHTALGSFGVTLQFSPQPWNLFTNFAIQPDGTIRIESPETKAGDGILLRAELDALVVVSACPQDQNLTCGGRPTDIRVEVGR